jgi:hypothetical protein
VKHHLRYGSIIVILSLFLAFFASAFLKIDWSKLWIQIQHVKFFGIASALLCIYISIALRAVRWGILLKTSPGDVLKLIAPQFVGFSSVALFGTLADLVRPYLLARKLSRPVSSVLAGYTVERVFDLNAAMLIISGANLVAPPQVGQGHPEVISHLAGLCFAGSLVVVLMLVGARWGNEWLIAPLERRLTKLSPRAGLILVGKIRSFQSGLCLIGSVGNFARIFAMSLIIWGLVALAYGSVVHSFAEVPELAHLGFSQAMILMAAGIGGSMVQFPILGWFTQIAATAVTMHVLLGTSTEASTACAFFLLGVTFLFVIPAGIVFAILDNADFRTILAWRGDDRRQLRTAQTTTKHP